MYNEIYLSRAMLIFVAQIFIHIYLRFRNLDEEYIILIIILIYQLKYIRKKSGKLSETYNEETMMQYRVCAIKSKNIMKFDVISKTSVSSHYQHL